MKIVTCVWVQCADWISSCCTKAPFFDKSIRRVIVKSLLSAINFAKWAACILVMYMRIKKLFSWALKSSRMTFTVAIIVIFSSFLCKVCRCWYLFKIGPSSGGLKASSRFLQSSQRREMQSLWKSLQVTFLRKSSNFDELNKRMFSWYSQTHPDILPLGTYYGATWKTATSKCGFWSYL